MDGIHRRRRKKRSYQRTLQRERKEAAGIIGRILREIVYGQNAKEQREEIREIDR
jgi:hypothetical protein